MKDETAILRSTQGETMSLLGVTARGKAVGKRLVFGDFNDQSSILG